jgi:4-methylaminobutanoate oxidase (formaldehyde-forming)
MPWPRRELLTERNLRQSALFKALADDGAVFGQKFGWERPNYFADIGTCLTTNSILLKSLLG